MRAKFFTLIIMVLFAVPCLALDKEELAVKDAVENLLQGTTVESVTRTALPGLFEVVVTVHCWRAFLKGR
jgi:hypothetical protein